MKKHEWEALTESVRQALLSSAGSNPSYALTLVFPELERLFELGLCKVIVRKAPNGTFFWTAAPGLQILGVQDRGSTDYDTCDAALKSSLEAVDLALSQVLAGAIDPWDESRLSNVVIGYIPDGEGGSMALRL